jgi:16S rRNA (guanine(966)-N(2))-methyltransferase RsmD
LRIIGGKYKGRVIKVKRNFHARPTTDFAREGLFNILSNIFDFSNLNILDLFGGTGAIGFEFASRGCRSVDIVEIDIHSLNSIQSTIDRLGITEIHTIRADAFRYIKSCRKKYHIVFADPPYSLKTIPEIPVLIFNSDLLEDDGIFILEHPKSYNFENDPHFYDHRCYGNVHFTFFRKI